VVSQGDVAGPAAVVGAVEAAGFSCYGGEADGVDASDAEVYFERGLGSDSEGEAALNCHPLAREMALYY
jgi:hypothetical protein